MLMKPGNWVAPMADQTEEKPGSLTELPVEDSSRQDKPAGSCATELCADRGVRSIQGIVGVQGLQSLRGVQSVQGVHGHPGDPGDPGGCGCRTT
jgi:hypothetical protein